MILIDTNTKMWTEITDLVVFRKKLLKFLQGVMMINMVQWFDNEGKAMDR